jgi:hypothetical protein
LEAIDPDEGKKDTEEQGELQREAPLIDHDKLPFNV